MKHFTIDELTQSYTADRLHINNIPDNDIKNNLTNFIEKILDPLRDAYQHPIIISSGYRCPELNKAVGGATHSGHQYGYCCDMVVKDRQIRDFGIFIKDYLERNKIDFDELIFEKNKTTEWVHFSYKGYNNQQRHKTFDIIK